MMGAIFQCGIAGLHVEEKEAGKAIVAFFEVGCGSRERSAARCRPKLVAAPPLRRCSALVCPPRKPWTDRP
jgi:hypothetical protein